MKIIERTLTIPKSHFFLFGPRGTGKSTWLKQVFQPILTIDLLRSTDFLSLSASPEQLRKRVEALPRGGKIVIDEIQKLPGLLDEIHSLIFDYKDRFQFALTGSSARQLKQQHTNLLAGRALTRQMFSLTAEEMKYDFKWEEILRHGALPKVRTLKTAEEKQDYLYSYVTSYLKEEIQQEAVVRNLQSYHRYLKHAALMNGQIMNSNSLSRDAAVARSTVDGYFSIMEETLLGFLLPPIQFKARIKEVAHPKFFFFDCGVVRALQNTLEEPLDSLQKSFLFETFLINEIRAYLSYSATRGEIGFWGTPSENEVDLIWTRGKRAIGVEIKTSTTWKNSFGSGLRALLDAGKIKKAYGVYCGDSVLKDGPIYVYPLIHFLKAMNQGKIFE